MAKGKYKARAERRREKEAEAMISELTDQLAAARDEVKAYQREVAKIPEIERAMSYAIEQATHVTSPRIVELEEENDKLRQRVKDIDESTWMRDRFVALAHELLVKHEGMTHWEAIEFLAGDDSFLIENEKQRRMARTNPEIVRTLQVARGLRQA